MTEWGMWGHAGRGFRSWVGLSSGSGSGSGSGLYQCSLYGGADARWMQLVKSYTGIARGPTAMASVLRALTLSLASGAGGA